MDVLDFYGDESCCTGGIRFMVLGGILVARRLVPEMERRLGSVREMYRGSGEMKWTKISRHHLRYYLDYVDVFFDAAERNEMLFTGLYVDSHTFNHRKFNDGNPDIGFSKLFYQLLLHKVGKPYGADHRLTVMLDERSSKDDPNELTAMLNFDLRRRYEITSFPFRRIEFRDSKKSDLIQLNDLLIGAMAFELNRRDNASEHKATFAAHVMSRARATCAPATIYGWRATTFKAWQFKYRQARGSSRA